MSWRCTARALSLHGIQSKGSEEIAMTELTYCPTTIHVVNLTVRTIGKCEVCLLIQR
jgi:hypothetical protein